MFPGPLQGNLSQKVFVSMYAFDLLTGGWADLLGFEIASDSGISKFSNVSRSLTTAMSVLVCEITVTWSTDAESLVSISTSSTCDYEFSSSSGSSWSAYCQWM
ncbi:GSCOCG00010927001-RA-CDS [Cotesia congregata]|nr:GSCOCG00010927001-RA-CDS [Cotesia congregata]